MKKPRMREKKWYPASERCERARASTEQTGRRQRVGIATLQYSLARPSIR